MKKLNVGVIGAGRIGQLHTENIIHQFQQVNLKAVSDPYLDDTWAENLGIAVRSADHRAILADDDIQAVLICSPSTTHADLIVEAARAGKHIFCEKPIALDPDIIKNAITETDRAGVILQVGFNRRFDPNFARIKSQLLEGKIGSPHIIKITSRDPEPPPLEYVKESGGMFLDMTIHDFDMACFLADSEVEEVFAKGSALINQDLKEYNDIDTAVVTLTFKNGAIAVIDNSRQAVYGYDQRVEVFGTKGCLLADNNRSTNTFLLTDQQVLSDNPLYFFLERYKEAFVAELSSFFDSVVREQPSQVSGYDGLVSVLIGLAANQSIRENRPVQLKF